MRIMGMIAAVLVLVAAAIGIKSLTGFGYGSWQIVEILVPMAIGVTLFFAAVTYLAGRWARHLNRPQGGERAPNDQASKDERGQGAPSQP